MEEKAHDLSLRRAIQEAWTASGGVDVTLVSDALPLQNHPLAPEHCWGCRVWTGCGCGSDGVLDSEWWRRAEILEDGPRLPRGLLNLEAQLELSAVGFAGREAGPARRLSGGPAQGGRAPVLGEVMGWQWPGPPLRWGGGVDKCSSSREAAWGPRRARTTDMRRHGWQRCVRDPHALGGPHHPWMF